MDFNATHLLIRLFLGGFSIGVFFWLSVKIVDHENRQNTLGAALVYGVILQALLLVPLAGFVVACMVLAFLFKNLDLELGELAVALFIIIFLFLLSSIPINWIVSRF